MKNKKKIMVSVLIFLVVALIGGLYLNTGFLQKSKIDDRDLSRWKFDEDGVILGAKEFTLEGTNDICWFVIHGYTSTPDEMREIAEEVHSEFNETVVVTRLKGNGEVPSHIVDLTLYDWYEQVSGEFDTLDEKCNKVNLIGFSFGGALSTRLAEKKDANNVYLLGPYLFSPHKFYRILRLETYLDLFADILIYSKKTEIGKINSKEGLDGYISYWNMPFAPVKNSKLFFKDIKADLSKIENPILLQHSKNDDISDIRSSTYIYENISSLNKEMVIFEDSNHIIPVDYDKEEVISNIINFEKETRK